MKLSNRFEEALQYSLRLHADQYRKGSQVPYFSHLISTAAIVMEHGGDEDVAIAALLHDSVEDQGGTQTLEDIRIRFGERVARIVAACSDTMESPKPPWKDRKNLYLAHLASADQDVFMVSVADKIHNVRTMCSDYLSQGELLWERFKGGKEGTLWYLHELLKIYKTYFDHPLTVEYERAVHMLDKLIAKGNS